MPVIERMGDARKKPAHKYWLFGELICPHCHSHLRITTSPPHDITIKEIGSGLIMGRATFQTEFFTCDKCGYMYDWEVQVSPFHW